MRYTEASELNEKNPIRAIHAHEDVSKRYAFISTENMLDTFAAQGWKPVSQTAVVVRKEDRKGFQKHMVRLQNDAYQTLPGLTGDNSTRPELVVINSHDRGSSMRILWGMFRIACLNGLILGDGISEVRLAHNAKIADRLPMGIHTIMQSFPIVQQQAETLANAKLSAAAKEKLIKTVYDAKLADVPRVERIDYRLPLNRWEDRHSDAFTVFNRVQEIAIRGGIKYQAWRDIKDAQGNVVDQYLGNGTTRAVKAIEETVRVNQLAFNTVMELVA